jgi:hypothetical protein
LFHCSRQRSSTNGRPLIGRSRRWRFSHEQFEFCGANRGHCT